MKRNYYQHVSNKDDIIVVSESWRSGFRCVESYINGYFLKLEVMNVESNIKLFERLNNEYKVISPVKILDIDWSRYTSLIRDMKEARVLALVDKVNIGLPYPLMLNYIHDCNGRHSLFFCKRETLARTKYIVRGDYDHLTKWLLKLLDVNRKYK